MEMANPPLELHCLLATVQVEAAGLCLATGLATLAPVAGLPWADGGGLAHVGPVGRWLGREDVLELRHGDCDDLTCSPRDIAEEYLKWVGNSVSE